MSKCSIEQHGAIWAVRLSHLLRFAVRTAPLVAMSLPGQVASQSAAPEQTVTPDGAEGTQDVVVTGTRPVIVNGKVRRCAPQAGDPLDKIRASGGLDSRGWEPEVHRYMAVVPHGKKFVWERDAEQITGPEFWQRVGVMMDAYHFRGMAQDRLMCVGGVSTYPYAFGGFRREFDATPYRGKRLRFTLWVATRSAGRIVTWLGSRNRVGLKDGGNTDYGKFGGDHLWTPILLETGPINEKADRISYGFNLQGSGDLWVYKPTFEVVEDYTGNGKDRVVFGKSS